MHSSQGYMLSSYLLVQVVVVLLHPFLFARFHCNFKFETVLFLIYSFLFASAVRNHWVSLGFNGFTGLRLIRIWVFSVLRFNAYLVYSSILHPYPYLSYQLIGLLIIPRESCGFSGIRYQVFINSDITIPLLCKTCSTQCFMGLIPVILLWLQ